VKQLIIDYGTLVAFGAISVDLLFEILRVWHRKSSGDISLWGCSIRFLSGFVLVAKFITLNDKYLIAGQVTVTILIAIYFTLILRFRGKRVARKTR
jgi:hypothetical protein